MRNNATAHLNCKPIKRRERRDGTTRTKVHDYKEQNYFVTTDNQNNIRDSYRHYHNSLYGSKSLGDGIFENTESSLLILVGPCS